MKYRATLVLAAVVFSVGPFYSSAAEAAPLDVKSIGLGLGAGLGLSALTNVLGGSGGVANPACIAETAARKAQHRPPPMGDYACQEMSAVGPQVGMCYQTICKGTSFSGGSHAGGADGITKAITDVLKGVVQGLMQSAQQQSQQQPQTGVSAVSSCTLSAAQGIGDASTTATLSWSTENVTSATFSPDIGGVVLPSGSRVISIPSGGTTYALTVYGPGGSGTCYASVTSSQTTIGTTGCDAVGQLLGTCTLGETNASSLTASPKIGTVPLDVSFTGSIGSCDPDSWVYQIDSDDSQIIDLPVSAGSCNFSATHTYGAAGSYAPTLIRTAGNGNAETLATDSVTVSSVINNGLNGTTPAGAPVWGGAVFLQPTGTSGNIELGPTGATIFATIRDTTNNTQTSSFFGADSTFAAQQSSSLAGRLCTARPWGQGFVASIIAPSFFDGLCSWRGYSVGTPVPPSSTQVTYSSTPIKNNSAPAVVAPAPGTLNPQAAIWAEPSSVRLGSRTSIFWATKDVQSCQVSGPSFSGNTLSGGAQTTPISGASTFSIICQAADGRSVTKSVTVNLAI